MANLIIWFSAYIGGEIKHVERAQIISIPGAALVVGTFTGLGCWLITRMVGFDFLNTVAYLGFVGGGLPKGVPINIFFYPFLGSVIFNHPAIVLLLGVSNIIWQMAYMPMLIQCMPRLMLSWAMDRLIPEWFGKVNRKFYTPHNAVLTCFIIGLIFLIIYTYTPLLTYASGLFFLAFTTMMVSIAATILPWRLPDVFNASPLGKFKIGRLPLITIFGIGSFIVSFLVCYQYALYEPAGFNKIENLVLATFIIIVGVIIWSLAKWWNKKRGIDISIAFKEIPPV
jgi:amino acid transporter